MHPAFFGLFAVLVVSLAQSRSSREVAHAVFSAAVLFGCFILLGWFGVLLWFFLPTEWLFRTGRTRHQVHHAPPALNPPFDPTLKYRLMALGHSGRTQRQGRQKGRQVVQK